MKQSLGVMNALQATIQKLLVKAEKHSYLQQQI